MEESLTGTTASIAQDAVTATNNIDWQEALLDWWHDWHLHFVTRAEHYLEKASKVDLTATSPKSMTWSEELAELNSFASWPKWNYYQECMMKAYIGLQDIGFWVWLTVRPWLYSGLYLLWRLAQSILGKLLPTIQYTLIEICRFQLHLTWRQALGELAIVVFCVSLWKFVRYLQRKKYIQRTRRYIKQKKLRFTKAIQSAYQEVFEVSILLAMAIPHAAFMGLCVALKVIFPSWVSWLSTETLAPSILKWWYPLAATIMVLHHARGFAASDVASDDEDDNKKGKSKTVKSGSKDKEKSTGKKKNRRRRSSFGIPNMFNRTAPEKGTAASGALTSATAASKQGEGDPSIYTEEEMKDDVNYWLHFWLLSAILQALHKLATRVIFVRTFFLHPTVQSGLCQLELLFFIWIFFLPQCFLVLYPSANEELSKDWSATKQWCYKAALEPVLQLPSVFLPVIVPFFEQVSQAITAKMWRSVLVEKVEVFLQAFVFMRILSASQKEAISECLTNFHSLVLPSITFLMPSFVTQYGVWYVEFIVPQAHSFRALHRPRRHAQRVQYLKFWIIHRVLNSIILNNITNVFWWIPFATHATFIVWCIMTMPRVINFVYNEIDRELQAFGFLPRVADDIVSVEHTHTVRALSYLAMRLPSAAEKELTEDAAKMDDGNEDSNDATAHQSEGDKDKSVAIPSSSRGEIDGDDGPKEQVGSSNDDKKNEGEEEKENQVGTPAGDATSFNEKAKKGDDISSPQKSAATDKEDELSPGQQLLRRSMRQRKKTTVNK